MTKGKELWSKPEMTEKHCSKFRPPFKLTDAEKRTNKNARCSEWYDKNKDAVLEKLKLEYDSDRLANSAKMRVVRANRTQKQKETALSTINTWRQEHAMWMKLQRRFNRWLRRYNLLEDDIDMILVRQNNKCNGCNDPLNVSSCSPDHVVAQISGGGHDTDNIQMLCLNCQTAKWHLSMEDFIKHARKIAMAHGGCV